MAKGKSIGSHFQSMVKPLSPVAPPTLPLPKEEKPPVPPFASIPSPKPVVVTEEGSKVDSTPIVPPPVSQIENKAMDIPEPSIPEVLPVEKKPKVDEVKVIEDSVPERSTIVPQFQIRGPMTDEEIGKLKVSACDKARGSYENFVNLLSPIYFSRILPPCSIRVAPETYQRLRHLRMVGRSRISVATSLTYLLAACLPKPTAAARSCPLDADEEQIINKIMATDGAYAVQHQHPDWMGFEPSRGSLKITVQYLGHPLIKMKLWEYSERGITAELICDMIVQHYLPKSPIQYAVRQQGRW